jgi:hypothetical protein
MRDMRTMIGIRDHLERFPPDDWMNATGTRWFVLERGKTKGFSRPQQSSSRSTPPSNQHLVCPILYETLPALALNSAFHDVV